MIEIWHVGDSTRIRCGNRDRPLTSWPRYLPGVFLFGRQPGGGGRGRRLQSPGFSSATPAHDGVSPCSQGRTKLARACSAAACGSVNLLFLLSLSWADRETTPLVAAAASF